MPLSLTLIGILWIVFLAYWWISALGAKKNVRGSSWRQGVEFRAALTVAIILLLQLNGVRSFIRHIEVIPQNPVVNVLGIVLCVAGIALAVWARWHLGRNWGMPMSLKEGHELVTTGPYRMVRHPIYTGFILAMLGSALVAGPFWLFAAVVSFLYFAYSASVEERLMMKQFPHQYPSYRKRTKMLIPFLW